MIKQFVLWQNIFMVGLDLCLITILGFYLFQKARLGMKMRVGLGLLKTASGQAGVALLIYFTGMAWVRGSLFAWRHGWIESDSGYSHDIPLLAIGTVIAVVGLTMVLRLFAQYSWERIRWIWIACVGADAIASVLLTIY